MITLGSQGKLFGWKEAGRSRKTARPRTTAIFSGLHYYNRLRMWLSQKLLLYTAIYLISIITASTGSSTVADDASSTIAPEDSTFSGGTQTQSDPPSISSTESGAGTVSSYVALVVLPTFLATIALFSV